MTAKDLRIKLINEILSGIKVFICFTINTQCLLFVIYRTVVYVINCHIMIADWFNYSRFNFAGQSISKEF